MHAHTARLTQNFLQTNAINVIDWPPMSPDLNPIEHLWDELGRRVSSRQPQPQNPQKLRTALLEEWQNIPQRTIRNVCQSMTSRLRAVITANGGHTRY